MNLNTQFQFLGRAYDYHDWGGNQPDKNERRVELALAHAVLRRTLTGKRPLLEIGNVTQHYWNVFEHTVVDLHEKLGWKNLLNEDVLDWSPSQPYDTVLSISTLEHTADTNHAIARVLSWGENVLITIPLGDVRQQTFRNMEGHLSISPVSRPMDMSEIAASWANTARHARQDLRVECLRRVTLDNRWEQARLEDCLYLKYGSRYPFANAIAVIMKGHPLG